MHRTEIYIREDQKDILQDYSYYLTKMKKERITISHLIREALDMWIKSSQLPKDVKPDIQLKKEKEGE